MAGSPIVLPAPATDPVIEVLDPYQRWIRGRILDTYNPWPKQSEFHVSKAQYRLYGGSAGPGKTLALLFEAIKIAAQKYDNVNTLLLRRTFPELQDNVILNFLRLVPRDLYRSYNDSKHVVHWWNGSTTRFGYAKLEKDIWQYQGGEWIFIGFDELTQFSMKQWQTISAWNRSTHGPGKMAGATNPIGPGHAWVNALWRKKVPAPGMEHKDEYNPDDYEFFPATLDDNPAYGPDTIAGRAYRLKLSALPGPLRRALERGEWDVLAGVYFDIFDRSTMTMRAEQMGIKPWWPRWISIDWGFEHPSAVYWHCQSETEVTYTYREYVIRKMAPAKLAQEIVDRSRRARPLSPDEDDNEKYESISEIFMSPDAFAKRTDASTIAQQMEEVFVKNDFPAIFSADNDRVGGWMLMYQLLESGYWIIAENCTNLIEVLPILQRDVDKNVEDILKIDGDDAADAARYGLKTRLSPGREPSESRIAKKVTSVDPTIRAIQALKAQAEERRASKPLRRHPGRFTPRRRR